MFAVAVLVFVGVFVVNAQVPAFGRCPEHEAMPDFDKERFMGKW